jgi:hypothetical protein
MTTDYARSTNGHVDMQTAGELADAVPPDDASERRRRPSLRRLIVPLLLVLTAAIALRRVQRQQALRGAAI